MASALMVKPGVIIPGRELRWRFSHSSGPGGQSVNTSDTRVELSLDIATTTGLSDLERERALTRLAPRLVDGVLTITASEHRSQLRNREAALLRLSDVLRRAIAAPPPPRRRTSPTRASVRRRLDAKSQRGALKRQRSSRVDE